MGYIFWKMGYIYIWYIPIIIYPIVYHEILYHSLETYMRWLGLVGSLKLQVSFSKEPCKRDYILQKRPIILRSLLIVATPYLMTYICHGISITKHGP